MAGDADDKERDAREQTKHRTKAVEAFREKLTDEAKKFLDEMDEETDDTTEAVFLEKRPATARVK